MLSIGELLANTLSGDQKTREDAQRQLEQAETNNYPMYAAMLCQELANEQSQQYIRSAAGIALKNSLTSSVGFNLNTLGISLLIDYHYNFYLVL